MTARPFDLIIYDFDGVLTDNRVLVDETGREAVFCHRGDGWWMGKLRELGFQQLILSTEKNPVVQARAKKLNLQCIQGVESKLTALAEVEKMFQISKERMAYVGNEMNDYEAMGSVGFRFCPSDSHPQVLTISTVLPEKGGYGIVRHLYDWILQIEMHLQP